ncbi:EscN/YscN/HrcN family type III secretion system ATPase, partial [Escherichia coli]|nr:EscN/YscN/HrcN family type III secretion system ATPase [Escherichia coli]
MKRLKLLNKYSYLHSINGSLIEAELDDVSVGEVCEIYASWQANERIARAQVVGFRNGKTLLNPKFHVCFLLASKITISRR